jgi:choice-of-anchor B domain-containing protein
MRTSTIGAAAVVALCLTSVLPAHTDDPKVRDTRPAWDGAGFRDGVFGGSSEAGLPVIFPASGVSLAAWLPVGDFGPGQSWGNDCWGYVSPSGREYAIYGLSDGTAFVEITDPDAPVIVDVVPGLSSIWRDIKTHGHYAYAVTEAGDGIQVIDLDQIDAGTVTLLPGTVTAGGSTASHNVAIDTVSGFLYRAGGGGNGLRVYDLSDPGSPPFVATWPDRYSHDVQVVTYDSGPYAGRQIAFSCGGFNNGWLNPGLSIVDVTDKQNLVELGFLPYPNAEYSHQGWLSMDRQHFYLNDELDESELGITSTTHIIDVSDLSNPVEVATYTNGQSAITHNLYVKGHHLFAANYTSGLRVLDISTPTLPVEVAYFDTTSTNDAVSYNGLWSNYPFFPSGTVIGSDREGGLFIWRMLIPMPADVTGEGRVDIADLLEVLGAWGPCPGAALPCHEDVDGDGQVDVTDLLEVLGDWD